MKDNTQLGSWLAEGPYTLAMSSGFFGFFAHCGMLSALEEVEEEEKTHLPEKLSGSSAGGLVAAAWAAGLSTKEIAEAFFALKRWDFWDPCPGPGLLMGRKFQRLLSDILPVHSFSACRVPVALSVYDPLRHRTRVITSGDLVKAVRATCAVPVLFHPTWIDGRPYFDGGVLDRPGIDGVPAGARMLYHHLPSNSPWRSKNGAGHRLPTRAGLRPLVTEGLPRVTPFHLHRGPQAYAVARQKTKALLGA